MSRFAMFFASGNSFYAGLILVAIAVSLGLAPRGKLRIGMQLLLVLAAAALIGLSSTPMAGWIYAVFFALLAIWLLAEAVAIHTRRTLRVLLRSTVVGLCILLAGAELRYFTMPSTMPTGPFSRVYVIGDSLSAGIGTAGVTPWPEILRDLHGIEVVDLSRAGATIKTAIELVEKHPPADGLVILEIGGNDLIGRLRGAEFEARLNALLQRISGPGRSVVMFELPLLPGQSDIGRAQRRLARKYDVILLPKRLLANLLSLDDATLDGLHLSATGHRAMADLVWRRIGVSLQSRNYPSP